MRKKQTLWIPRTAARGAARPVVRPQARFPLWALIAFAVFAAAVFLLAVSAEKGRMERQKTEALEAQALVETAYARRAELERRLAFAQTDEYVEQQAREAYGYLLPDTVRLMLKEEE